MEAAGGEPMGEFEEIREQVRLLYMLSIVIRYLVDISIYIYLLYIK